MRLGDERFNGDDIRRLYESKSYSRRRRMRPALRRLVSHLRQVINDPRDARFIMSMSQIVGIYNATPTQVKWLLDIYRRVRQSKADQTSKRRGAVSSTGRKPKRVETHK
jgi:hypothetical protein